MRVPILIAILCFAYSSCRLTSLEEKEKEIEEDLFRADSIRGYVEQTGKGQMLILPGIAPINGGEGIAKILTWLKTKGFHRYNSTILQETDLGNYYLQIGSYSVYDKHDSKRDKGTVLKFYKRTSGKPTIVANGVVSDLTPWPLNTSQLGQDHYRKRGFVLRVNEYD